MKTMATILLLSALGGCSSMTTTYPGRSASEELVMSTAIDRAAYQLAQQLPPFESVFIDASLFDGTDAKYAVGSIRAELARRGTHFSADRAHARTILEVRAGALSIDRHKFLIGIPEFTLPFPLAGTLAVPEIAIYSDHTDQGVAKFAAMAYDETDGRLLAIIDPLYGYSHNQKKTAALFVTWTKQDFIADKDIDPVVKQDY